MRQDGDGEQRGHLRDMNWLNIQTQILRSPEFIGSDPVARATWLYVFAYCAEQENGGRIEGAKVWKDRQWQQTCGVTLAEVEASTLLLFWEGNDLVLHAYPMQKEYAVQRLREIGKISTERKAESARENGKKGGRPRNPMETHGNPSNNPINNPTETHGQNSEKPTETHQNGFEPVSETQSKPKNPTITHRKEVEVEVEVEGKGKERKGERDTRAHVFDCPNQEAFVSYMVKEAGVTEAYAADRWGRFDSTGWVGGNGIPIKRWQSLAPSLQTQFRADTYPSSRGSGGGAARAVSVQVSQAEKDASKKKYGF